VVKTAGLYLVPIKSYSKNGGWHLKKNLTVVILLAGNCLFSLENLLEAIRSLLCINLSQKQEAIIKKSVNSLVSHDRMSKSYRTISNQR
jgi:hypothetical protein